MRGVCKRHYDMLVLRRMLLALGFKYESVRDSKARARFINYDLNLRGAVYYSAAYRYIPSYLTVYWSTTKYSGSVTTHNVTPKRLVSNVGVLDETPLQFLTATTILGGYRYGEDKDRTT